MASLKNAKKFLKNLITCMAAPWPSEPMKIQSIAELSESSGKNSGLGNNFRSFATTPG